MGFGTDSLHTQMAIARNMPQPQGAMRPPPPPPEGGFEMSDLSKQLDQLDINSQSGEYEELLSVIDNFEDLDGNGDGKLDEIELRVMS